MLVVLHVDADGRRQVLNGELGDVGIRAPEGGQLGAVLHLHGLALGTPQADVIHGGIPAHLHLLERAVVDPDLLVVDRYVERFQRAVLDDEVRRGRAAVLAEEVVVGQHRRVEMNLLQGRAAGDVERLREEHVEGQLLEALALLQDQPLGDGDAARG